MKSNSRTNSLTMTRRLLRTSPTKVSNGLRLTKMPMLTPMKERERRSKLNTTPSCRESIKLQVAVLEACPEWVVCQEEECLVVLALLEEPPLAVTKVSMISTDEFLNRSIIINQ